MVAYCSLPFIKLFQETINSDVRADFPLREIKMKGSTFGLLCSFFSLNACTQVCWDVIKLKIKTQDDFGAELHMGMWSLQQTWCLKVAEKQLLNSCPTFKLACVLLASWPVYVFSHRGFSFTSLCEHLKQPLWLGLSAHILLQYIRSY